MERLFTTGLVKLLFTTETFALGVNMPARTVAFASLKKFDGVRLDWLLAREYGQMAGRAGRQGIDPVGFVYSIVDDRDMDARALEHLFEGPLERVESRFNMDYATLLNLYALVGERIGEAYEKSFARFQRERREGARGFGNRPAREAETLRRRVAVMKSLGYIAGEALTAKGKFAAAVQGFEVHAAEFLESGILHACDPERLVLLFCAAVFEERRGDASERVDPSVIEGLRQRAEHRVAHFRRKEFEAGLEDLSKELDWKIWAATVGEAGHVSILSRDNDNGPWYFDYTATTRAHREGALTLRNHHDFDLEPMILEDGYAGQEFFYAFGKRIGDILKELLTPLLLKVPELLSEAKVVIPHSLSFGVYDWIFKSVGVAEKAVHPFHRYGNCVSVGLPLGLSESVKEGRIKRGDRVLMAPTGSGISAGVISFRY